MTSLGSHCLPLIDTLMRFCMILNKRRFARYLRYAVAVIFLTAALFYLILPLIFWSSPYIQRHFIFGNDVSIPQDVNFSNPDKSNLLGSCNRHLTSELGVTLAFWQVLPFDLISTVPGYDGKRRKDWFLQQLGDERPVVLYCHGNNLSRATGYRILLYQVLQKMNFHVVAFDYRGFADSSSINPSEDGVVEDTLQMVKWIRLHSKSPLYVWGHSLGTGIATEAVAKLCSSGEGCPDALILQAPFTSIEDELNAAKLTKPFRVLPWFNALFLSPLANQGLLFDNKENIKYVHCPVLILHAKDDAVVPFYLGEKLYDIARKQKKTGMIRFVSFEEEFGYGHNYISKAPELPVILRKFLEHSDEGHFIA